MSLRYLRNLTLTCLMMVCFGVSHVDAETRRGVFTDSAHPWAGFFPQRASLNSDGPVKGLNIIRSIPYNNDYRTGITSVKVVFDDAYAYIATPDGLYRTSRTLNSAEPLKLIGFENKVITNLYVYNNVLYVLKVGEQTHSGRATDHSFLKSEDRGQTFIPLDKDLEYCLGGDCLFLTPTRAEFVGNLIFLNAGSGRNLLVSKDQGASWSALSGSLGLYSCSEPAFEVLDNRVLMGGECPLDFAYLWAGILQPDLLSWVPGQELKPMSTPPLGNRNFQFIERRDGSPLVFAGVEGGLLKSSDAGLSFRFVIQYPISASQQRTYPYLRHILFPSKYPDLFLTGGFDKPKGGGPYSSYLAYSTDHGESWVDFSPLTHTPELSPFDVAFLAEDPEGRVLLGLINKQAQTVTISEVLIEMPAAPTLVTEAETGQALALDSVSLMRGPFPVVSANPLSNGQRTRISLFARNINLLPGEDISVVTVQAEDSQQRLFQLPVEFIGKVPNFEWLSQLVVRLPEELPPGEVQVSVRVRGVSSNKALVTIK